MKSNQIIYQPKTETIIRFATEKIHKMKTYLINIIKKHKIIVGIILFFLIWILFFDEYNLFRIRKESNKLESLKEEKVYLKNKIEVDRLQLEKIQNDNKELERIAREDYLLKKENEDVFIIIEE
jgi:cell division protein DivIC